jgi:hypothetical protein
VGVSRVLVGNTLCSCSQDTFVDDPQRRRLADEQFEMQVLLQLNRSWVVTDPAEQREALLAKASSQSQSQSQPDAELEDDTDGESSTSTEENEDASTGSK